MLFNRPIRALLPQIGREPINVINNDEYYEALKSRQETYTKNNDTHKESTFFSAGSTVAVKMDNGVLGCMPWLLKATITTTEDDPTGCEWQRQVE